jgi:hypothetical protein
MDSHVHLGSQLDMYFVEIASVSSYWIVVVCAILRVGQYCLPQQMNILTKRSCFSKLSAILMIESIRGSLAEVDLLRSFHEGHLRVPNVRRLRMEGGLHVIRGLGTSFCRCTWLGKDLSTCA